jgi:hypothetical protein
VPVVGRKMFARPAAILLFFLGAGLLLSGCGSRSQSSASGSSAPAVSFAENSVKIWDDFVLWGQQVVYASKFSTSNLSASQTRWNEAAMDLGDIINTYYGQGNGNQAVIFFTGLQQDIMQFVNSSLKNDSTGQNSADLALSQDANNIAAFLNGLNPDNWSRDSLLNLLETMITGVKDYASRVIGGQWDPAVDAFDAARDQTYDLANTFSSGILAQFPDKF